MPIYAYKCETCGFSKDVLRKISDPPLTKCPSCGADTFQKQVTAAGFQLKGSGWYVTDFRGGNSTTAAPGDKPGEAGKGDAAPKTDKAEGAKPAGESGAPAPAAAPAPAPTPTASKD